MGWSDKRNLLAHRLDKYLVHVCLLPALVALLAVLYLHVRLSAVRMIWVQLMGEITSAGQRQTFIDVL
jgi:hypothetical protein